MPFFFNDSILLSLLQHVLIIHKNDTGDDNTGIFHVFELQKNNTSIAVVGIFFYF